MNKSGLYSQRGFEFQLKFFVLNFLKLNKGEDILYEGLDDIEVENNYIPIMGVKKLNNTFIQVKSGDVGLDVFKKIIMNWLLNFKDNINCICCLENSLSENYLQDKDQFVTSLIKDITETNKSKRSIIGKVKSEYIDANKTDILKDRIYYLINQLKIEVKNVDDLNLEIKKIYLNNYAENNIPDIINNSRIEYMINSIRGKIADSILKVNVPKFEYKDLIEYLFQAKEAISDKSFDITFKDFRINNEDRVSKYLDNSLAAKQLRLVRDNDQFIIEKLVEEIFYKQFRDFFINTNLENHIDNLELYANDNYKRACMELEADNKEMTPMVLYLKTTEKRLESPLFRNNSTNNNFYSEGCYIFLTDDDAPKQFKIEWGKLDD